MSKRTGPVKVKLSDFRERKELEGAIDIETDDGQTFRVPPPEVWPDDVQKFVKGEEKDIVGLSKAILGNDRYAAFCAAGGSAALLNAIFAEYHGADVGESPASSSS